MKKMMFIAAIALCAMSCGNKAANTEAQEEAAVVEEVVVDTLEVAADSVEVVEAAAETVAE